MTWRSAADHIDAVMEARERAEDRRRRERMDRLIAAATKLREEREARLAEIRRKAHCDECAEGQKTITNMGCLCCCHVEDDTTPKLHLVEDEL